MTELSVSFAGNLTDDPEVRYTEFGIVRSKVTEPSPWPRRAVRGGGGVMCCGGG
jgi:hypothetical protein